MGSRLKLFWKIWDISYYVYLVLCFLSITILIFGIKAELKTNQTLKDAMFCENSQINFTKLPIGEQILFINGTENQKNNSVFEKEKYKECSPIAKKISEKADNIYRICVLYVFVYLGFMLYYNKDFRDGVLEDLRNVQSYVEKLFNFKKIK